MTQSYLKDKCRLSNLHILNSEALAKKKKKRGSMDKTIYSSWSLDIFVALCGRVVYEA